MFFIHVLGRRRQSLEAQDLDELSEIVIKAMDNKSNDAITVAIGKTDSAVVPYVWIRRNDETDEWEGELGDSIRLGIDDNLLVESDPLQILGLEDAIRAGFATVKDTGAVRKVASSQESQPKSKKLSNEEKLNEAKRMVDDLFANLCND